MGASGRGQGSRAWWRRASRSCNVAVRRPVEIAMSRRVRSALTVDSRDAPHQLAAPPARAAAQPSRRRRSRGRTGPRGRGSSARPARACRERCTRPAGGRTHAGGRRARGAKSFATATSCSISLDTALPGATIASTRPTAIAVAVRGAPSNAGHLADDLPRAAEGRGSSPHRRAPLRRAATQPRSIMKTRSPRSPSVVGPVHVGRFAWYRSGAARRRALPEPPPH